MSDDFISLVENDTQPVLPCTYTGVDMSAYRGFSLHIPYRPLPLAIAGVIDGSDSTTFNISFLPRVTGVLANAAAVGATTVQMTVTGVGQSISDLPSGGGELLIDSEHVQYSSRSGSTLTLATSLASAHASGAAMQKLPDLRKGTWPAQVEVLDAGGGRLTFPDLELKIEAKT